ncbi:MAG: PQQ-like beta-propeller repeat protein, partial [Candidatus Dormibacteraeota bacterium]|nr:PQQ-like beta-propeller repeat protein [Candidatus Dormibacteraeota bacterium]
QGNVVVTWGGLDGDCGNYHGYVETVTEATGKVAAVWQNTPNDNEGGIWTPAGPAVDAAGDIFVASGNGSTTNIGAYDDANSVTKLSPGLMRLSFFAPGPPQQWTALNASDNDLGSTSPALLSNGLLFQIGKGGRGYLLSQSQLPNNSNPGGGEAASLQVCDKNSFAALSGVAVAGSMVFVPCVDGIAAVSVESPTAMHRVWYSAAGSSAPIVAGGVVWSAILYGGTTLYGLDPANGNVVAQLNLGNTTMHFATPAAANGRLYMAAGSTLLAFAPH